MTKILFACAMAAAIAIAAPPQKKKPDFSGTWKLDPRSRLESIPDLKSSVITIDHHEPKIHIETTTVSREGVDKEAFDLATDGVARKATAGSEACSASARWDSWTGTRLMLVIKCDTPQGPVVTTRQMMLGQKDKMMTTILTVQDKTGEKKGYGFYVKEPEAKS
jgi:hypothetical protein